MISAKDFNGFSPIIFDKESAAYFLGHFQSLRDGSLNHFSQHGMKGIITFPSFHAVLAFINVFAFKGNRWLYPVTVATCIMILLSTPIIGGHYLIDVIAGLAVTWVTWHAVLKLRHYIVSKKHIQYFDYLLTQYNFNDGYSKISLFLNNISITTRKTSKE